MLSLLLLASVQQVEANPSPRRGAASIDVSRIVREREGCPPSADGEIVVCGDRTDSLRMPEVGMPKLNSYGDTNVFAERMRVFDAQPDVLNRCSAVGPEGWTGCQTLTMDRRRRAKEGW